MAGKSSSDVRSPLSAPPLRNPGQSLDEEIHRLVDDKLMMSLLPAFAFLIAALLEWLRWWQQSKPNPLLYTLCALVATGYAAYPQLSDTEAQLVTYHLSRFMRAAVK